MQTRLSVLIPTHKRPQLLLRAVASLQQQSLRNWEALVVDDGAGEGIAVCEALGEPRVRALANPGKGQVAARNAALARAKGEAIALLDDDDWLEDPHHLRKGVRALAKRAGLVYRGGWLVGFEGKDEVGRMVFDTVATPKRLQHDNLILASGLMYPRHLHQELGSFDGSLGDYWDWDWYLRVVGAGYPLIRLRGLGVGIAQHGGNMSYGVRLNERRQNLARLSAKHGLVGIELKDHSVIAAEA